MQEELDSSLMWVLVKMVNAAGVEGAGPADNAVNLVTLG